VFEVKRHGGKSADIFRTLIKTDDENRARERFKKEKEVLRQGSVQLLHNGQVLESASAPRLRSKW
jgi:hypothetical protein